MAELTEWMAFYQLEPWGSRMEDMRAGEICAVVANVMAGTKGKSFKPSDFFPPRTQQEQRMLVAEKVKSVMTGFKTVDKRKSKKTDN